MTERRDARRRIVLGELDHLLAAAEASLSSDGRQNGSGYQPWTIEADVVSSRLPQVAAGLQGDDDIHLIKPTVAIPIPFLIRGGRLKAKIPRQSLVCVSQHYRDFSSTFGLGARGGIDEPMPSQANGLACNESTPS